MLSGSFLFWVLVEFVLHVKEGILRQHVASCLDTSLPVEFVSDVGELAEDVETVGHEDELAFHGCVWQADVPYEVVGVERRVVIASA